MSDDIEYLPSRCPSCGLQLYRGVCRQCDLNLSQVTIKILSLVQDRVFRLEIRCGDRTDIGWAFKGFTDRSWFVCTPADYPAGGDQIVEADTLQEAVHTQAFWMNLCPPRT